MLKFENSKQQTYTMIITKEFKTYTLRNFTHIPQIQKYLSSDQIKTIKVVGTVLPFKVNNYVLDELIDWDNFEEDPIFILTFPQKEMLKIDHYNRVEKAIDQGMQAKELKELSNEIRLALNPNPAGQMDHNVPIYNGERLDGVQHKYEQTLLFFSKSRTNMPCILHVLF
jgi:L-lysine 2,3-aminomutase